MPTYGHHGKRLGGGRKQKRDESRAWEHERGRAHRAQIDKAGGKGFTEDPYYDRKKKRAKSAPKGRVKPKTSRKHRRELSRAPERGGFASPKRKPLKLLEGADGHVHVAGATEVCPRAALCNTLAAVAGVRW